MVPHAALATAVPLSPKFKLKRSPSPLTNAIASFTKVGHAIIGDTSPGRINNVSECSKQDSSPTATSRGRSEIRRSMMNRPPIAIPINNQNVVSDKSGIEDVYAQVDKKRNTATTTGDSSDVIATVTDNPSEVRTSSFTRNNISD